MRGLHVSCNYDPETSVLKSKLRFAENVITTKLADFAFEINNIKESKPYSILVLEDVVNDLKKEKLELSRKNDELRKQNISMSHTISDFSELRLLMRVLKTRSQICNVYN